MATTGTTNKGNHMIFLRTKEFIKYHFINNIVNNLLLIIHIAVILSMSVFVYSNAVKADGVEIKPWQHRSAPKVLIFKHGNINNDNKFIVYPRPDCTADMWLHLKSFKKDEVKKLENTFIDLKFTLLTEKEPIPMWDKNRVAFILDPAQRSIDVPYVFVSISLGHMSSVKRLVEMKKDKVTSLSITAPDQKYFNNPHEEWSFEGVEEAVFKLLKWCGGPQI
jgi:hypothetical protein